MANIGNNWSFLQLLDNSSKIVIPIIQRDYAQGRTASYNNKRRTNIRMILLHYARRSAKDLLAT